MDLSEEPAPAPDPEATQVLDLSDEPPQTDVTESPVEEVAQPATDVEGEADEDDPIGAVEESLAVWGAGGRPRPWERSGG